MRILNLIQCTNLGGMEQVTLRLLRGLQTRGHAVRLLSLNPIGALGPLLAEAGIPYTGLPYLGKGGWHTIPMLRRELRASQADALIMTGHHLLGMLALGDFCANHRLLALHFHHQGVKPDWQWRLIYRAACRRFPTITYPSDFIRQEAISLHAPVARLAQTVRYPLAMPPAISPEERQVVRRHLGLAEGIPFIGNAGWLIPRKRFNVFLRVAHEALKCKPTAVFLIAGDGEERAKLEALANSLGIAESVKWLGWQKEMRSFYAALDVLLFNSDWDALPVTPQEAMAHGVPVVCSVINGGLREIITSDEVGFLRASHDVQALAGLVIRLLEDHALAKRIGLAGRARVEGLSRVDPIVEWHERILLGTS